MIDEILRPVGVCGREQSAESDRPLLTEMEEDFQPDRYRQHQGAHKDRFTLLELERGA